MSERQGVAADVATTVADWFPHLSADDCDRIAKLAVAATYRAIGYSPSLHGPYPESDADGYVTFQVQTASEKPKKRPPPSFQEHRSRLLHNDGISDG